MRFVIAKYGNIIAYRVDNSGGRPEESGLFYVSDAGGHFIKGPFKSRDAAQGTAWKLYYGH